MSNFIALTKVLLKTSGQSYGKEGSKKKLKGFGAIVILILAFTPMAIQFGKFVAKIYEGLAPIRQEGLILGFALAIVSVTIFFFAIFYSINTFYFSMDIESLLPLPFKPSEIMGAKFATILIYEYVTTVILYAPAVIAFGIKSGGGLVYYLYSTIIFILLPVVPIVIASLINMLIMRFTNIAKNKDRFRLIGGIIGMVFGVGINIVIQKTTNNVNQNELVYMFKQGNNSMVDLITRMFPTSKLAVSSMMNASNLKGVINLLLFLAVTIAFIMIFVILGEALYFKGVIGISETSSKRRKLSSQELSENTKQNSKFKAYVIKEFKLLVRTPIYFMSCIISSFLWPVFLLLPFIINSKQMANIKEFTKYLQDGNVAGIVIAGAFAISIFTTSSNAIASTAISREGKNLFILKYLPMNYKNQLIAKTMSGAIMGYISTIIIYIVSMLLLKLPSNLIIVSLILSILGVLFSSFVGIVLDLNFPKLIWETEQKAVKQNFNVAISMFICIGVSVSLIFLTIKLELGLWSVFIGLLAIFIALDLVLYYFICTKGVEMFNKIEG